MNLHRLLTITLLFGLSGSLQADNLPLITSPGTGDLFGSEPSVTLGNQFQVGPNPLTVTALGLFDSGAPGLDQSHSVGLWTAGGTLLAEVDFSPGLSGFSLNGFLYQNLASSIVLQPGTQYIMGASYQVGTTDLHYANDTIQYETWSSAVTFIRGRYTANGAGFTFPNLNVGGLSYVGANLEYTVPEPGAVVLFLNFAAGCMLWRTGRRLVVK
jgi:hypothetical protein